MNDDKRYYAVPIQVLAIDAEGVTVQAVNQVAGCPQCETGQGCGQNPWFQGFVGKKPLRLPKQLADSAELSVSSFAELLLPHTVVLRLALLTYALPLAGFIVTLMVCAALPVWLQFFAGLCVVFILLMLNRFLLFNSVVKSLSLRKVI